MLLLNLMKSLCNCCSGKQGYPGEYVKGKIIQFDNSAIQQLNNSIIFHAGTTMNADELLQQTVAVF